MSSLGANSGLAAPLGADSAIIPPNKIDPYLQALANRPSGIRFANAGAETRRLNGQPSNGRWSNVSGIVIVAQGHIDNIFDQSGAIQNRRRKNFTQVPLKVRG